MTILAKHIVAKERKSSRVYIFSDGPGTQDLGNFINKICIKFGKIMKKRPFVTHRLKPNLSMALAKTRDFVYLNSITRKRRVEEKVKDLWDVGCPDVYWLPTKNRLEKFHSLRYKIRNSNPNSTMLRVTCKSSTRGYHGSKYLGSVTLE